MGRNLPILRRSVTDVGRHDRRVVGLALDREVGGAIAGDIVELRGDAAQEVVVIRGVGAGVVRAHRPTVRKSAVPGIGGSTYSASACSWGGLRSWHCCTGRST